MADRKYNPAGSKSQMTAANSSEFTEILTRAGVQGDQILALEAKIDALKTLVENMQGGGGGLPQWYTDGQNVSRLNQDWPDEIYVPAAGYTRPVGGSDSGYIVLFVCAMAGYSQQPHKLLTSQFQTIGDYRALYEVDNSFEIENLNSTNTTSYLFVFEMEYCVMKIIPVRYSNQ